ncbi:MAG TPA: hypothetical protein VJY43_06330 [Methanocorpusculum sp.]|nr:hypothetical protein [Methanocorpusculum sp.]
MTEEKKTSIFGKIKKAIIGENCSCCCCSVKTVPEKESEKSYHCNCCKDRK